MKWRSMHPLLRAGLIVLIVCVVVFGVFATRRYMRVRQMQRRMRSVTSMEKIEQLYFDCYRYGERNGGEFPPTLDALVPEYAQAADLVSPLNPKEPEGYIYNPGFRYPPEQGTTGQVVIEDKFGPAIAHERILIYGDGEWGMQQTGR